MTVHVTISFGLGGSVVDDSASGGYGENYLIKRLRAVPNTDVMSSPYVWSAGQSRFDDIMRFPKTDKIAMVGDSLGDNALGSDLHNLEGKRAVDFIGGFQGSVWGQHTSVSSNCRRALLVFNPVWWQTAGLGDYPLPLDSPPTVADGESLDDGKWRLGNNGNTWVRYVQIEAPHPDDWGLAQDIIFSEIKQLAGA
jgi:hypothetical protein